jgi:CheY-like chemotaxis protein
MNDLTKDDGRKDGAGQKQVVLVIDGKAMRQFYTSVYLQRMDYHVIMAKTAEDALLFLELTVPLALLANYDLPGMNGLDLLKHVKEDERTRNVPVIIYTSNKDPMVHQTCEAAGCAAFLRHPCSLDDLYTTVRNATGGPPRKFVRLNTRLEVVIEDIDDDRLDFISDLSEDGMFVSTTAPLPYGSIHTYAFHLPNAPGWVLRVEGQVQHLHLDRGERKSPGMGVKFVKIGEAERELVKDFIKRELTGGIVAE